MKVAKVYKYQVCTFRRTLELHIGWDKQYFEQLFKWTKMTYENNSWVMMYMPKYNCNLIRLRDYNLPTLVHELVHACCEMCDQCWLDYNSEPMAYIYEELFTKIWCEIWSKFTVDEVTKKYFTS